ncbi:MAG: peptide deformylase [bacterium]|nr:peptide deformylase [bacterium]
MARLAIIQEPHKTLRKKARELAPIEIKSKKIQKLIRDMSETLRAIEVGIGLAAPQVGKSLRIFLVSEEAMHKRKLPADLPAEGSPQAGSPKSIQAGPPKSKGFGGKHLVFINPKITKTSKKKNLLVEGCLSVSAEGSGKLIYGQVERFEKLTVEAQDASARKFTRGASELFAQVLQHELDHLNGTLFIDKAREIKKIDA